MSWARARQTLILTLVGILIVLALAFIGFKLFYKAPSCTDGKLNGKEQGIDCGGPCPYLCSVSETPLQVRFVSGVNPAVGRTDVIAYVDNSNANAGIRSAQYSLDLYGPSQDLIAHKTGTVTIPPSTTVPLYIARAYIGSESVSQAFLTFASSSEKWLHAASKPVAPMPDSITISSDQQHVTAILKNTLATPVYNVTVVATVFDAKNNAIAASQTVVATLPPQGSKPISFSWNQPFSAPVARVEILPTFGS
jgi:hypothetical protein